jgi:hypothetical protein
MKTVLTLINLLLIFLYSFTGYAGESGRESCRTFWQRTSANGNYNFSKHSIETLQGNLGYKDYASDAKRDKCIKDWTILVYMAADNDLSPYAYWDLHEMESQIKGELNLGASTDIVDVVVELDTLRRDGIKRMHMFQMESPYQATLNKDDFDSKAPHFIKSPVVEVISEDDKVSTSKRFSKFLEWGVKAYPSRKYMVIVWGHGEGFIGRRGDQSINLTEKNNVISNSLTSQFFNEESFQFEAFSELPDAFVFPLAKPFGGVAFDHSDKSYLTIPDIANSLKSVQESQLKGEKVDILAFDACLMQSLEVLSELSSSTDFLVGSNQIQNYLGMPYRSILDQVNRGVTPVELAKQLPELTKKSWSEFGYQRQADAKGFETFTMSSVSSWHVQQVIVPELQKVSELLLDYLDEASYRKSELLFLIENAPRFQGETIDLGLFYGLVEQLLWQERLSGSETKLSGELRRMVAKAGQGVQESTLSAAFGPLYYDSSIRPEKSYLLGFFKATSVWLPKSKKLYKLRINEMGESLLHQDVSAWNRVLNSLYEEDLFDLGGL